MKPTALILCVLVMTGPALAADMIPPAARQVWQDFTNERFGASAKVPTIGFVAEAPPANGDGQAWTAQDGTVRIAVYGSYWTVFETDFPGFRDKLREFLIEDGVTLETEQTGDTEFGFAGTLPDGRKFRDRTVIVPDCDIAAHTHIEYPASQAPVMDAIANEVTESLAIAEGYC